MPFYFSALLLFVIKQIPLYYSTRSTFISNVPIKSEMVKPLVAFQSVRCKNHSHKGHMSHLLDNVFEPTQTPVSSWESPGVYKASARRGGDGGEAWDNPAKKSCYRETKQSIVKSNDMVVRLRISYACMHPWENTTRRCNVPSLEKRRVYGVSCVRKWNG